MTQKPVRSKMLNLFWKEKYSYKRKEALQQNEACFVGSVKQHDSALVWSQRVTWHGKTSKKKKKLLRMTGVLITNKMWCSDSVWIELHEDIKHSALLPCRAFPSWHKEGQEGAFSLPKATLSKVTQLKWKIRFQTAQNRNVPAKTALLAALKSLSRFQNPVCNAYMCKNYSQ